MIHHLLIDLSTKIEKKNNSIQKNDVNIKWCIDNEMIIHWLLIKFTKNKTSRFDRQWNKFWIVVVDCDLFDKIKINLQFVKYNNVWNSMFFNQLTIIMY